MPDEEKKFPDNTSIEAKNISQANNSKILAPDQEDKKLVELARLLSEKMGLSHFQQEIDLLKETNKVFLTKLQEVVESQNQTVNAFNSLSGTAQHTNTNTPNPSITTNQGVQNFDISKLEVLGNILDKAAEAYTKYKSATNPSPTTIIDPEVINEHLKKSMLGNFEVGEALTETLKSKVTGKAMSKIVTDIIKHEPE